MKQLEKTTKDRILEKLKKDMSLSVNELSDYLEITHMAIRKHLNALEKDGLISTQLMKLPVGRPVQKYFLTTKGKRLFPNNYESISVDFLKDIQELHGEDSISQLFKRREARQITNYSERLTQLTDQGKVEEMVKIQNEKGYMAEFNHIDDNQFEIMEYNCPIFAVASEFHIACQCETNMFKNLLGTEEVERAQCKTEGNNHCRFVVKF
ncbi:transcriptional regulator [Gracilibacillus oryzae]|uniref:Transcriptional regulator n=1 Tax=Gracilibacillus oryzae TaxID=1672701 RepID=A0A7C8KT97_9BACI|nr:metalloregulator ArsR/SmtB family transcription factor [Gracilibacillus oryzae]KAB8137853.1 transcriptional regulator [Gracilibacillus oryzae]